MGRPLDRKDGYRPLSGSVRVYFSLSRGNSGIPLKERGCCHHIPVRPPQHAFKAEYIIRGYSGSLLHRVTKLCTRGLDHGSLGMDMFEGAIHTS